MTTTTSSSSSTYAIGIDVGTGSVRCMIFDEKWTPVVQCQKPIRVRFMNGFVIVEVIIVQFCWKPPPRES